MRVCADALVKSGEYQSNSDYVRKDELVEALAWLREYLGDS